MITKAEQLDLLIKLAKPDFTLSVPRRESEYKLLRSAIKGEEADYGADNHNLLSASLIAWLCTYPKACSFLTHRGISIVGAKIEGNLNLKFASLNFPLVFRRCTFTQPISLERAKVKFLDLSGSYLASSKICDASGTQVSAALLATGIHVESDLLLSNVTSTGRISLDEATISGNLNCENSIFHNSEGLTLVASGARIKGAVLLRNVESTGRVSLEKAIIGRDLVCKEGTFYNPKKPALLAQGLKLKGSVNLSHVKSAGLVSLDGATIGGDIIGENSIFCNPAGLALVASGADIKGAVLLRNVESTGRVSLDGVLIGGDLDCERGTFFNLKEPALDASGAEINGSVLFRKVTATGLVSLDQAIISGDLIAGDRIGERSTFNNPKASAIEVSSAEIKGAILLRNIEVVGSLELFATIIGGDLDCRNGKFKNPAKISLYAQLAEIKGYVYLSDNFESKGEISLSATTIGGNLDCSKGKFDNPERPSLFAKQAEIKGVVRLSNIKSTGCLSLYAAIIGGDLICKNSMFYNPSKPALIAQSLEIGGSVLLGDGLRGSGFISFRDAIIQDRIYMKKRYLFFDNLATLKLVLYLISDNSLIGFFFLCNFDSLNLDFQFATVRILADDEESWPLHGKLQLYGFSYQEISQTSPIQSATRLKWLRRQGQKNFSPQPYEQLAQVLQRSGHNQAATEVLIGKQEDLRCYGKLNPLSHFWNLLLGITIAHGYQPLRALIFALGFIIAGIGLFDWGYSTKLISPSHVETFKPSNSFKVKQISDDYPKFNSVLYSVDTFIPIMDLYQKSYWLPNANRGAQIRLIECIQIRTGGVLRYYFWFHIIMGWLLTSLWVAGFTGLVRRLD